MALLPNLILESDDTRSESAIERGGGPIRKIASDRHRADWVAAREQYLTEQP